MTREMKVGINDMLKMKAINDTSNKGSNQSNVKGRLLLLTI